MTRTLRAPDHRTAARDCSTVARRVAGDLAVLRDHLVRVGGGRAGMAGRRLDALVAGYDIYAAMLDDALTGLATGLLSSGAVVGVLPRPHARRSRTDPVVDAVEARTAAALNALREQLALFRDAAEMSPAALLEPFHEWDLAVDGLFGPTGVLAAIVPGTAAAGDRSAGAGLLGRRVGRADTVIATSRIGRLTVVPDGAR